MGSFSVGTLTTAGCNYTCTISYSDPVRSGDNITIKNVKATITVQSGSSHTLNRIAVSCSINGSSKGSNVTVLSAQDSSWPDSKEVTLVGSGGYTFSCLNTSFAISATFRSTGYGSDWNSDYGSASKSGSVSCPARTYAVTFNANGGSGAPASQTKTYNVNLGLSSTIPTRAAFAFKGWSGSDGATYQAGATFKGNYALTLTAIWQALVTDLEDVEDCEIGEAPVLAWTPQSADLTYMINFSLGEWSWLTQPVAPQTTSRYVYSSYTVPMEVCRQLPNQTEGLMKVELETYNAGERTGVSEKYFTVSVPDSVVPEITGVTIEDASHNALNVYLQNYSWVFASLGYAEAYGSEIVEATMSVGGSAKNADSMVSPIGFESDVLPEYGVVTLTFSITDQRGRSATESRTITVNEYAPPTLETDISLGEGNVVTTAIDAGYSTVGGINHATYTVNGGTAHAVVNGEQVIDSFVYEYAESRNYTFTVVVEDAVTSVTVTKDLYPGRGNRFSTLAADEFYIGIDENGWKDTASVYDGGVTEDGTIWFRRSSGDSPIGVGFPFLVEADNDYELIYSADRISADTVAYVSFFQSTGSGESDFSFVSTLYAEDCMRSGAIFHTPTLETEGTLWAILVLGVAPVSYEDTPVGYQEFRDILIRMVSKEENILEWEAETGVLGLDTPNQKYISRLQLRIEYVGSLKIGIAYDNAPSYETVHKSSSGQMRSRTVAINVRRCDHFRLKLEGKGQAKLYSFGYHTEDGSARCLI